MVQPLTVSIGGEPGDHAGPAPVDKLSSVLLRSLGFTDLARAVRWAERRPERVRVLVAASRLGSHGQKAPRIASLWRRTSAAASNGSIGSIASADPSRPRGSTRFAIPTSPGRSPRAGRRNGERLGSPDLERAATRAKSARRRDTRPTSRTPRTRLAPAWWRPRGRPCATRPERRRSCRPS